MILPVEHRVQPWSKSDTDGHNAHYREGSFEWMVQRGYVAFYVRRGMKAPVVSKFEVEQMVALITWAENSGEDHDLE